MPSPPSVPNFQLGTVFYKIFQSFASKIQISPTVGREFGLWGKYDPPPDAQLQSNTRDVLGLFSISRAPTFAPLTVPQQAMDIGQLVH